MKNLLLPIIALLLFASCSMDEEKTVPFHMEFLPVENEDLPSSLMKGYEYDIKIKYIKPTDCHYFEGFYYRAEGPVHIIAPQTMVLEIDNCEPVENTAPEEATFRFTCSNSYQFNSYIFKFYRGEDTLGNLSYYTVEVPVVN